MIKLIFTEEDLKYFTGEPLSGFLIIDGNGRKKLYTSDFDLARKAGISCFEKKKEKDYFFKLLKQMKIKKIGIDFSKMGYDLYKSFVKHRIKPVDLSKELAKKMAVKSGKELQKIKQAAKLADEAMELMRQSIRAGITEQQLAAAGQKYLESCEAVSFPFIVEFGENTMYTHYPPTAKKLKQGEMIIIDLGFKYHGYCSDITRTFCIKPSAEQKETYELAKYAQTQAVSACRKNIEAGKVYSVAEKIFDENDVLENWKYGLGHGIGLRIHEYPSLQKDSKDKIYERSAFTIEPGLAIPKLGGCRVEDDFVMKSKAVQITKSPKELEV